MPLLPNKPPKAELVTDLLKRDFPDNPSYIDPMVLTKGGTLLLGGEAKVGKSFLMLELCRALTCGGKFMDNPAFVVRESVRVLYCEAENGERTNKQRVLKIFEREDPRIWGENFYHVSKNLELQLDNQRGIQYFADLIHDVRPNVLVLDPISFMYHKDENSAQDIGNLFMTLARLKERGKDEDLSIVFSHHFKKPPYGEYAKGYDFLSEYNFRGSSKWKDGGDSLLTMQRYAELPRGIGDEAWKLKLRFLCRHGPSAPEGKYTFNKDGDLRIKWGEEDSIVGGLPKLKAVHRKPKDIDGTGTTYAEDMAQEDLFTPARKDYGEFS